MIMLLIILIGLTIPNLEQWICSMMRKLLDTKWSKYYS